MIARNEIYACPHCGNIVEVLCGSNVTPSCCGSPMTLKKEGTSDGAAEKHVPVIEAVDGGYKVTVGSVAHPMEEKHYIQWIELLAGQKVLRQYLAPGDAPEAFFACTDKAVTAREYCNLHGHWAASRS